MEELIRDFLSDCQLRDMTNGTLMNYKSNLRIFFSFLKENQVSVIDVDFQILREFLGYLKNVRHNSMKRISNYFSALSSFFDYKMLVFLIFPLRDIVGQFLLRKWRC